VREPVGEPPVEAGVVVGVCPVRRCEHDHVRAPDGEGDDAVGGLDRRAGDGDRVAVVFQPDDDGLGVEPVERERPL